jgi:16S rRNA (cytosine1402-N4)-methyltransferase
MATAPFAHTTVLLQEAVDALVGAEAESGAEGIFIDGTFGRGGHSRALLARLGPGGRLIAFDKDLEAVRAAQEGEGAISDARFSIHHASFASMAEVVERLGLAAEGVEGVLLDLGVSSPQIDNPARGFSFRFDGPLDMRMDTSRGESAADFLARADERHIAEVIRDYGEERFAVSIAKALVARREASGPLRTTAELAELVARSVRTREPGQDPATRTFQALRIHVNAELEELGQGLKAALALLAPGGRLAVISFHSLEDRIVKTFIAHESRAEVDRRAPFAPPTRALRLRPIARIKPSEGEIRANGRSRSAVLRVAERLAPEAWA